MKYLLLLLLFPTVVVASDITIVTCYLGGSVYRYETTREIVSTMNSNPTTYTFKTLKGKWVRVPATHCIAKEV